MFKATKNQITILKTDALRFDYWPLVLILSAVAAGLAFSLHVPAAVRVAVELWFVTLCPGMSIVRITRIRDHIGEWGLAVALSLALALLISSGFLYAGHSSSSATLAALVVVTIVGALVQVASNVADHLHVAS